MSSARAAVQRIDAWLAAQRRAVEDRDAIANMSVRQLRDIGIERSSASTATEPAWFGEYPR
jgi:uncharacterized protein YjiS (DUF1127 family)